MLLYAITQRSLFPGDERQRSAAILAQARILAAGGVDYLQIREKDLPSATLQSLAHSIVTAVRSENSRMKILLNGPPSAALETGCDGIHLSGAASHDAAVAARRLYQKAGRGCIISAACHSLPEVSARSQYADLLLLAPIFEKIITKSTAPNPGQCLSLKGTAFRPSVAIPDLSAASAAEGNPPQTEILPGIGLAALSEAVAAAHGVPVIALGGVTAANAVSCLKSGANGIAAIRLFLTEDWKPLTRI